MKEFTKLDKNLIFCLSELLIDNKTVTAIFTMLKTQEKRRKMFYFIRDNFNFVTESNILSFACALDNKREQRMPAYLIVKYIGETTDEITNGKLYQVGVCYDAGQVYKIKTDKRHIREYPSNLFIEQRPTEIEITYLDNPIDGEVLDDLVIGNCYKIVGRENDLLVLDNGNKCFLFRGDGVDFEDAPQILKMLDKKELLRRYMLFNRFNNSWHIIPYISDNCVFDSDWSGAKLQGKDNIIKRIREIFQNCVLENAFYDMNLGSIELDGNKEPCLLIFEKKSLQSICIIDTDENGMISKIKYLNYNKDYSIYVDSRKQNIVEVVDGHDCGGSFWIKPCNVNLIDTKGKSDYWNNVTESKDELSIDELDFGDFLAYFFIKNFDTNLDANLLRYTSTEEKVKGFGWYLDHNFYTYEQIDKILAEMFNFAEQMRTSPREELEKNYPSLCVEGYKPFDIVKSVYENCNYNPCATYLLYRELNMRIREIKDKNPDMKYFSVMGP